MRASCYKKTDIMGEGFRLRTMRFRGQISQGLLLPVSQFPEIPADAAVGDDVSELLGVRKWEIEERATTGGTVIGTLPYDIPHTDETRVQENPELIGAFANLEYYISTKMDGTSKGGMAIAVQSELKIPVKYIGIGESLDDLQRFDPDAFTRALFDTEDHI